MGADKLLPKTTGIRHDSIEAAAKADVRTIAFRSGGWDDASLNGAAQIYDGPADLLAHYDASLLGRNHR